MARPVAGSPWSHLETTTLIASYAHHWLPLSSGHLNSHHWSAVAAAVASKSPTQCRHKIEKLRKRYRAERALCGASTWPYFPLMDRLKRCSSSSVQDKDDSNNSNCGSEWSTLANDILVDILRRLNTLQDFCAVRGVCRNWRSVATPSSYNLSSQSPLLLVICNNSEALFDFTACRPYSLQFPWAHPGRRSIAYSHGYIITIAAYRDDSAVVHLWSLFTGVTTILPRITEFPKRVILSTRPPRLLVLIYSRYRPHVDYLNIGDTRWTVAGSPCLTSVVAMMFFREELLALTKDMDLLALELAGGSLSVWRLGGGGVVGIGYSLNFWLGEIDGVLLAVCDHGSEAFKVFMWDWEKKEWEEVHDLGDKALFISDSGYLVSISATGLGLRKNCVYYSICYGWAEFSLEDGSYKEVDVGYPTLYGRKRLFWSPAWVFPSLC